MPYKLPLTEEQLAKRKARSRRAYYAKKARGLSPEELEKRRAYLRAYMVKWREKPENREKQNAQARIYSRVKYAADPAAVLARNKASYLRHHERRKAEHRAAHHANREQANAARKANALANPERERATKRMASQRARVSAPWYSFWRAAQRRAAAKGVPFTIMIRDLKARWTGRCEITGIPFDHSKTTPGAGFFSPSLDRIKPELGYTPDNIRFILWAVNAFKGTGSDEDVLLVAKAIIQNFSMNSKG